MCVAAKRIFLVQNMFLLGGIKAKSKWINKQTDRTDKDIQKIEGK